MTYKYKYYIDNYDNRNISLSEHHKNANEGESRFDDEYLDMVAEELADYEFHNCDGWDWWKQGREYPMYIWDINDVYLGKCTVGFETEPVFYAREDD